MFYFFIMNNVRCIWLTPQESLLVFLGVVFRSVGYNKNVQKDNWNVLSACEIAKNQPASPNCCGRFTRRVENSVITPEKISVVLMNELDYWLSRITDWQFSNVQPVHLNIVNFTDSRKNQYFWSRDIENLRIPSNVVN